MKIEAKPKEIVKLIKKLRKKDSAKAVKLGTGILVKLGGEGAAQNDILKEAIEAIIKETLDDDRRTFM